MKNHQAQRTDQLAEAAAGFISTWSNRKSLITVTRADLTRTGDRVTFYISVYPEDAAGPALGFLMRKRTDCRAYLKKSIPLSRIPHVEFVLDDGEKNRLRVDELLQE